MTGNRLLKEIGDIIKRDGPIPFSRFMEISLYHPELGYYAARKIGIGGGGDFITSAQASPLFGALLAVQACELFGRMGTQTCHIVEYGPGTGAMAASVMEYLSRNEGEIFSKLTYHLVEPLESRWQVLENGLDRFRERISISMGYPESADAAVIIANEVLDAFPVHVIHKRDGRIFELFIDIGDGADLLEERLVPLEEAIKSHDADEALRLSRYVDTHLSNLPEDYRTEVNLGIEPWLSEISRTMDKGFLIIIDYGFSRAEYLDPARNRGTMIGYHRHRVTEDLLSMPGFVDMTAHVNFSDLRQWSEEAGFSPIGYAPQWAFLGGLDFDETVRRVMGRLDPFSPELAGIKALIFPQAMGESHKVMMLSKGMESDGFMPKGFSMKNDLDRV